MSWKALLIAGPFVLLAVAAACDGGTGSGGPFDPHSARFPTDVPACQPLNDLDRYEYVHTFRWFSPQLETTPDQFTPVPPAFALIPGTPTFDFSQRIEGQVVNPDRVELLSVTEGVGEPARERWVEGRHWTYLAEQWIEVAPQRINFSPPEVCNAVMDGLDLDGVTPTKETIAGLQVDHYQLRDVALHTAATLWGPGGDPARLLTTYDVDVWLTEDGWPLKLEVESEGQYPFGRQFLAEIGLEMSNVNNDNIIIEPPTEGPDDHEHDDSGG